MATIGTDQGIGSGDIQFAERFASKVYVNGIVKNPILGMLTECGCINIENALDQQKGGKVTLYNRPRLDTPGVRGDKDFYSLAEFQDISGRTLNIEKNTAPTKWRRRGSQDYQYAPYNLDEGCVENISTWTKGLLSASIINQLAGNTATSISHPSLYASGTFNDTDDTLLQITGNNAAIAPTYWYEANLGGAITTDAGVVSSNKLTIADFENAVSIIESQDATKPTWQTLSEDANEGYCAVALISRTGQYQLMSEAVTAGQGPQFTEYVKASMAGGKDMYNLNTFMLPGLPLKFCVVPDSWMPRGVTTSGNVATANTRRAVIVGSKALDMSFGQGMQMRFSNTEKGRGNTGGYGSGNRRAMPGISIEIDADYKPLNKETYANACMLYGAKKAQQNGLGSDSGNSFDLATFVITHYSAT